MRFYCTYIMSNYERTVFYIGVTGSLFNRIIHHKQGVGCTFTTKYRCYYLLYYEEFHDPRFAINREKQLKNWKRQWKIELIQKENPHLKDLAEDWL